MQTICQIEIGLQGVGQQHASLSPDTNRLGMNRTVQVVC